MGHHVPTESQLEQIERERSLATRLRSLRTSGGDESPSVGGEIEQMYFFLWKKLARRNCSRLAHRGRQCAGSGRPGQAPWVLDLTGGGTQPDDQTDRCTEWADEARFAYRPVIESYRDAVFGRLPGASGGRTPKGQASLLETWAAGGPTTTFSAYFSRSGVVGNEEALRQWNSARGLRVRFASPPKVMRELRDPMLILWPAFMGDPLGDDEFAALGWPEGEIDAKVLRRLIEQVRPSVIEAGLNRDDGWYLLARSLWWDACQAPGEMTHLAQDPFDRERVARYLRWARKREDGEIPNDEISAVAVVANFFDSVTEIIAAPWWKEWIDRPRRLTHDGAHLVVDDELMEWAGTKRYG